MYLYKVKDYHSTEGMPDLMQHLKIINDAVANDRTTIMAEKTKFKINSFTNKPRTSALIESV